MVIVMATKGTASTSQVAACEDNTVGHDMGRNDLIKEKPENLVEHQCRRSIVNF